jgi:hypothetical protein
MKWVLLLSLLAGFACAEPEALNGPDETDDVDEICGTWIWQGVSGDTTVLRLTDMLEPDKYGLVFNTDSTLVERKNTGWCGTPPISYANFDGTWERASESLLDIEVGYWGGTMTYQLEIVELQENELHVRYHYPD